MNATALLIRQHETVHTLLRQLEQGNGQSNTLLDRLSTTLTAHMVIEQELFYPAIFQIAQSLILEACEEHEVMRFALDRLLKAPVSDRTFQAKLTTLKELIEHHEAEEETKLFPAAEKDLGDESKLLRTRMQARFMEIMRGGYARAVGISQSDGNPANQTEASPALITP